MANGSTGSGIMTNYNWGQKQQSITDQINNTNITQPNAQGGGASQWSTQRTSSPGAMSTYQNPTFANNPNVQSSNQGGMSYGDAMGQVAPNLVLGGLQTAVGLGGLLTQGDVPQYQDPQRLEQAYQEYGQMAQQGMPEVLQSADQRLARSTQTGRQEAMDQAGPSTANAINAAMTSQNLEGQRQIAEMEQQQKLRGLENQVNVAQTLRNLEDQRTQAARQRYGQEEASFGKAAQSGMGNLTNALNLATGIAGTASGNPMAALQGGKGLMGLLNSQ